MQDLIEMSEKELKRLELIGRVISGDLRQLECAQELGLSDRHIRRLVKKYKDEGKISLISKRRGRPSPNQLDASKVAKILDLLRTDLRKFNPTHACEKLNAIYGLKVSKEKVRQLLIKNGLWKAKRKKKCRIHQTRSRRERFGELVQIDGSPHKWFEDRGPRCCLIAFIDDATSQIMALKFVGSETTNNYFQVLKEYMLRYGRPEALYSDRHSIFRINKGGAGYKGNGLTQFGRALKELDIDLICANSPQAKGRVERLFKTLQERLVAEMRLAQINTIEDGNRFLADYIAEHNRKFSVTALGDGDAHRALKESHHLENILCRKEVRKLSKNLELSFDTCLLQIITEKPTYSMRHAQVEVIQKIEGDIEVYYKGVKLKYKKLITRENNGRVLDRKSLLQTSTPRGVDV